MSSTDTVGVTFVNHCLAQGIYNGVINVTLGHYLFTPKDSPEPKVDGDLVVACRLRLDLTAAEELYTALGNLLTQVKAEALAQAGASIATASAEKAH